MQDSAKAAVKRHAIAIRELAPTEATHLMMLDACARALGFLHWHDLQVRSDEADLEPFQADRRFRALRLFFGAEEYTQRLANATEIDVSLVRAAFARAVAPQHIRAAKKDWTWDDFFMEQTRDGEEDHGASLFDLKLARVKELAQQGHAAALLALADSELPFTERAPYMALLGASNLDCAVEGLLALAYGARCEYETRIYDFSTNKLHGAAATANRRARAELKTQALAAAQAAIERADTSRLDARIVLFAAHVVSGNFLANEGTFAAAHQALKHYVQAAAHQPARTSSAYDPGSDTISFLGFAYDADCPTRGGAWADMWMLRHLLLSCTDDSQRRSLIALADPLLAAAEADPIRGAGQPLPAPGKDPGPELDEEDFAQTHAGWEHLPRLLSRVSPQRRVQEILRLLDVERHERELLLEMQGAPA